MKRIPLSQGKFALVDDSDYEWLNQWKWSVNGAKARPYAMRKDWSFPKGKTVLMHRLIANPPKGFVVDHIDGNTLNNCRSNLRVCSYSQNLANSIVNRLANKSGYKGVCWKKKEKKYSAQITVNYKAIHLGYFKNPVEAAKAYDNAARKYFGEFAKTNF
jgi:hypothetical protein